MGLSDDFMRIQQDDDWGALISRLTLWNAWHMHITYRSRLYICPPFVLVNSLDIYVQSFLQRKAAEKAEKASAARKGKKDPKAPKRPLSAYMFFSQDWRERIKAENPDAGFGEVGKLLGAKWKELDDEEKKPYVERAAQDKTRAEKEKAAYEGNKKGAAPAEGSGEDEEDDEE
ncbi:hypothetical protein AX15_004769 [Amanita polypyramis BW_CC]|nr:hypothetical protein AX15_004769 [Amanita polypyramis BW_CC]